MIDYIVLGLGATGFSSARYLARRGHTVVVNDSRASPPFLSQLKQQHPEIRVITGQFDAALIARAGEVVISPGIARDVSALRGRPMVGDIELFAREAVAPIIAITGTNGKTTVTTLVGEMLKAAGLYPLVGGNIGTPVLDLLEAERIPDYYVLELSSFQLEVTTHLRPEVAVVLNVAPDHLDRHTTMAAYRQAKYRIYHQSRVAIVDLDDPKHWTGKSAGWCPRLFGFSMAPPRNSSTWGVIDTGGVRYLSVGDVPLMPVNDMVLQGAHNVKNALAAMALGAVAGVSRAVMCAVLRTFRGLDHRCQWIARLQQVDFYNDSKGTNVHASIAAIQAVAPPKGRTVVLIAGGILKERDLALLQRVIRHSVRAVVLIGRDAPLLAAALENLTDITFAKTLPAAVRYAVRIAQPGDSILLSPVCASFDMFDNYVQRGEVFVRAVRALDMQSC